MPVKTVDQQMIASLHRVRSTWLATRTARLNTVRGVLREFGIVIPVGAQHVVPMIHTLTDDDRVPPTLRPVLVTMAEEVPTLEATIRGLDQQLATLARQSAEAALLQTVPGVGVITATALLAVIGSRRAGTSPASWG